MRGLTLREVDEASIGYVERLLERADLPTADVRSSAATFYVGRHGGGRVGVAGLEIHGSDALLRSVAVEPSVRGRGFGTALCDRLERKARTGDVETLYLLTTTATDFFVGLGYVETERAKVPAPIRGTAEFADLCPSSATCLQKSL
jgi:amino-acid N-acetyltransferase